ncbi:uncharacterized protein BJ171DRAFT_30143 [Polychytrium aggregatum]|uniref:uncharacterized protein n=1 Tax=Polychytrium aggregatum TaxID=110093 RepID=UPI0022FE5314|nr:uncharacterized protein BJ171DRAFT_30143 [Polychytrium aggregatum]KAI9206420.1 hypothetical protein BJ171DRAFT_30143 [Polychytrium aggregatum]
MSSYPSGPGYLPWQTNPELADCVFVVDSQIYMLHSSVLTTKSKYFQTQFGQAPPSVQRPYQQHLPSTISAPSFETLLKYLYENKFDPPEPADGALSQGDRPDQHLYQHSYQHQQPLQSPPSQLPPPSQYQQPQQQQQAKPLLYSVSVPKVSHTPIALLVELYGLAAEYQIEDLRLTVAKAIVARLNVDTVREMLVKAQSLGIQLLLDMAESFARRNGMVLVAGPDDMVTDSNGDDQSTLAAVAASGPGRPRVAAPAPILERRTIRPLKKVARPRLEEPSSDRTG